MYLFADSGSTKTKWIITDLDGNEVAIFKTIGLNPYFVTEEKIIKEISENYPSIPNSGKIKKVFFYGSGCSPEDEHQHLISALKKYFNNADVEVYSDMLGTARAIYKDEEGIAAIIGTGTNSCFYSNKELQKGAISLGYVLGDEGSGAYIGKKFAKQYLEKRFDPALTQKILDNTGATHTAILSAVYSNPHPNRYLAGFCIFIKNNIEHPQLQELVKRAFSKFFENYVKIYPDFNKYPLGFCGSIAINFQEFIIEIANSYGINDVRFVSEPLKSIIEFHKIFKFN
jgi:N-acetylglucosamine kinase-like BadF-type ATPase